MATVTSTPAKTAADDHSPEMIRAHWSKTQRLTYLVLGLWFFFSFVVHFFAKPLNEIVILGFPLGFYMAAQGSLIAFVVILFWFAKRQDQIDREYGFAEEE
jgi:putative solute:sodium symporter small subunit